MKKKTVIIIFLLIGLYSYSQENSVHYFNQKYIAWYSPSKATHIYGFMFNFFPEDKYLDSSVTFPNIYGVELNLNFIGLFTPFMIAIHSIDHETHEPVAESLDSIEFSVFKKIHGLQLGLINMEPSIINGLDISATGSFMSKTNGLTLSLVMNKHYISNGVTFALIGNHDTKCNGIQIGLINSCRELKGVQFGLWNKNQKRRLPIVNWSFK